ncbi:hypothetical protein B0A49_01338 [Cryomyces minteri]|uniref:General negative regulator of transcription subunit n=1 Tax=Cryomyces minteri TaxID=331657 RepID=A0A4U0XTU7_9PEZI|nr:hypothetical protein B0A49_03468 [Cryomyces minteri]TKA81202.1 hypothetical protein B0A49_01338 [Cryomyces minteri]
MAQRKLQQEIDKCFKKVAEQVLSNPPRGVAIFESLYDKIQQSTNPAQKEKLEDALKKEIKKLQRSRDQIKGWAASNEIKDKKPLLDHRKLTETEMEKFKAVEKEMKTKAYSKEGLSAAAKLDPKEKEKLEICEFLQRMVEELERQIETVEAETEALQVNVKKGKKDTSKADRIAELERTTERHKWHQGKLELLLRSLENGGVDTDQVKDLQESITYYVENNQEVDFMEDDSIYDDLNLDEEEDLYGMPNDVDRVSSQDAQSVADDMPDVESRAPSIGPSKPKASSVSEAPVVAPRRPSTQLRSPLPALATLHTSLPNAVNGTSSRDMKPAPLPTIASGQPLKYASAAAAAAASDKSGVGIMPLPPPPGTSSVSPNTNAPSAPQVSTSAQESSATTSPSVVPSLPVSVQQTPAQQPAALVAVQSSDAASTASTVASSDPPTPAPEKAERVPSQPQRAPAEDTSRMVDSRAAPEPSRGQGKHTEAPGESTPDSGIASTNNNALPDGGQEPEPIYHLPSSLQDLLESFEATKSHVQSALRPVDEAMLTAGAASLPDSVDASKPYHYKPQTLYAFLPPHYPKEPLMIFDDSRLYNRIDTDTLFYAFYYRQGTYQQYLAAKALKQQSWRFHKQYQTWFQRHEEPKTITEEFEQGTYRFFDYESTWMNRRKADFKFAYKFLEDDL